MAPITLEHVTKVFVNGHIAVRDLTLEIADGELLVLVGPSGSGKSTVLRLIAGLESPTAGRIRIDGQDVTAVPPQGRDLAMVFQTYALYPHKTVRENLSFALSVRHVGVAEVRERVGRTAAALGIEELLDRKPAQLSGGQRQRVALGRAIVREPKAFLLDEPLSNLDPLRRGETRAELAVLHRRLRATMVYVTHDQEEAMTLGGRVAVMRDGSIEQLAPPMDLYRRPANVFVGRFVGSPGMNVLGCTWRRDDGRVHVVRPGLSIEVSRIDGSYTEGATVLLGARPQDVELAPAGAADATGRVEILELLGATTLAHVRIDDLPDGLLRIVVASDTQIAVDQQIGLRLRRDTLHFFTDPAGVRLGVVP
ncbi:MAG: ATP-binding cassette domain-containing protein [Luteitalea sp.]|nr:ATP-binding cassette domain-containing protein [Luteitalea sp.]